MRIEIRLFATLVEFVAGSRAGVPSPVELAAGTTMAELLTDIGIPPDSVHLVVINGRPTHDPQAILQAGDRVSLFPPVGGG